MIDVLSYVRGKRKNTSSGWVSFNAVCCVHNGNTADKRGRGGLKVSTKGWSYHCFNCGYTASFILGRNLSFKARKLLTWLSVPKEEIERINLESLKHRNIEGILHERQQIINQIADINFPEVDLPANLDFVDNPESEEYQYLISRAVPMDYPYMTVWNGDSKRRHHSRAGVLIPFTYNNEVVGHTIRFLDNRTPKYINEMPSGYVFGTDLQNNDWNLVIVCEGVFDALSISGLAVMHNEISDKQARLIRNLGKEVIVVPDHDQAGLNLIDDALKYEFSVSIPPWPSDVKDINDSVKKFGKLATLMMILEHQESSHLKIQLRKKQLAKKI